MFSCFGDSKYEKALMRNGRSLLEKSVALNNGRGNPVRCFSVKELQNATNSYSQHNVFYIDGTCRLYKGLIRDRPVIVKKYDYKHPSEDPVSDIVIASEMSVHRNVLKLLGCRLESEIPIPVFEYAEKGTLEDYVQKTALLWKDRLKIAVDVASVIAYLHTAFPRPIVHRDISLASILLDEDCAAKVTGFSLSISIPEGETHIEDEVAGTIGYVAPEYFMKRMFNEKIDVYSFGVVLLVLLTGHGPILRSPTTNESHALVVFVEAKIKNERFNEIIDPAILEEGPWPEKEQQLKSFLTLAMQCTRKDEEDRPEITDVAKQLRHIYHSLMSDC
ncbi:non-functional pseudokinase ZED1 [Ricinus communis]|uniref:non-functional pseudokinase ZED1 n=1 Tax=Ricinus communis TaxID=3988 RepID=UPI00201A342A|nr:non-functional pseudokinase ZED1 [Ricinus communis]